MGPPPLYEFLNQSSLLPQVLNVANVLLVVNELSHGRIASPPLSCLFQQCGRLQTENIATGPKAIRDQQDSLPRSGLIQDGRQGEQRGCRATIPNL